MEGLAVLAYNIRNINKFRIFSLACFFIFQKYAGIRGWLTIDKIFPDPLRLAVIQMKINQPAFF